MANVALGCIFHWKEYQFADGEKADKYFVILGAKTGANYLAAIATSKQKKKKFEPGCHSKEGYYHIPGGKKDWFEKDTWLLLTVVVELSPAEFVKRVFQKEVNLCGNLRQNVANEIRNCLKYGPDASPQQIALL